MDDRCYIVNKFNVYFESVFQERYSYILDQLLDKKPLYFLSKRTRQLQIVPETYSRGEIINCLDSREWRLLTNLKHPIPRYFQQDADVVLLLDTCLPENTIISNGRVAIRSSKLSPCCVIGDCIIEDAIIGFAADLQYGVIINKSHLLNNVRMNSWVICYAKDVNNNASIVLKVFLDTGSIIGIGVTVDGVGAQFHNIPFIRLDQESDQYTYVGKNSILFSNSTVTSCAKIGRWSVVGAHSLVSTNVSPYSMALGSPATVRTIDHSLSLKNKSNDELKRLAELYIRRKSIEELTSNSCAKTYVMSKSESTNIKNYWARVYLVLTLLKQKEKLSGIDFDPIFHWLSGDTISLDDSGNLIYEYRDFYIFKQNLNENTTIFHRYVLEALLEEIFFDFQYDISDGDLIVKARTGTKCDLHKLEGYLGNKPNLSNDQDKEQFRSEIRKYFGDDRLFTVGVFDEKKLFRDKI